MLLNPLGARRPTDTIHLDRHALTTVDTPITVNHALTFPSMQTYYDVYNQGSEGSCVGFGSSWAMTLLNRVMYAARQLYLVTQTVDEWPDTPPEEGTSLRAAMDVLRTQGHWRLKFDHTVGARVVQPVGLEHGIEANKWASSVDQGRGCIASNTPIITAFPWYENFDNPVWDSAIRKWRIGQDNLGRVRGWHCTCYFAAWDKRNAFELVNNWGAPMVDSSHVLVSGYPKVLMPYEVADRMLQEGGEMALVTDRAGKVRAQK